MTASAQRLGLDIEVEVIPSSNWLASVRFKIDFLIDRRAAHRGPLLYVDVDAIFHSDPWAELEDIAADVSFPVLLDGKARSGTIYLAGTIGAPVFLTDWKRRLDLSPDAWDQHPLNDVFAEVSEGRDLGYTWQNLPPGLCYIFDRADETAGPGVRPVVEHLQASRDITSVGSPKQVRRVERLRSIDSMLGLASE
jgi:hypothetical protein